MAGVNINCVKLSWKLCFVSIKEIQNPLVMKPEAVKIL